MKTIADIAEEINMAAAEYKMHDFQEIRSHIHTLARPKTRKIFSDQTIHDEWAFHSGGRKEFQFNIGFEYDSNKWFRYGLAFSLEPSRTLPAPLILKPKVLKLNEYIRKNQTELEDVRFWYYFGDQRSPILPVTPVPEDLIRENTFLFWGKMSPIETIKAEEVLFLFDRLLPIYEFVEGNVPLKKHPAELEKGFRFKPGHTDKKEATFQQTQEATKAVVLRHNKLQAALHSILSHEFGALNAGEENDSGRGSLVDLVVRDGNEYVYYEIKTSPDIRHCFREAIAQLIEYSYWPGGNEAAALIVVSENPLTPDARRYLVTLRERFHLPIFYQRLDLADGILGNRE